MARPVTKIELTTEQRLELQRRTRSSKTPQRDSLRARIILLRAAGKKLGDVAEQLRVSIPSVSKWSRRFQSSGLAGLQDAPGRGRKAWLPKEKIERVLDEGYPTAEGAAALECPKHGEGGGHFA